MRVQPVSATECTKIVLMQECAGNVMEETKHNLFSFKASPMGGGYWMRTVKYSVKNCVVQEKILNQNKELSRLPHHVALRSIKK